MKHVCKNLSCQEFSLDLLLINQLILLIIHLSGIGVLLRLAEVKVLNQLVSFRLKSGNSRLQLHLIDIYLIFLLFLGIHPLEYLINVSIDVAILL